MNDRLLTEEEIGIAIKAEFEAQYPLTRAPLGEMGCYKAVRKAQDTKSYAQDTKTREQTLKDVGEWLDLHCLPLPQPYENKGKATGYFLPNENIESLKKGELPK